eukprot:TRINITY_DN320_c0_g2_i6.p1 TRINITY_DN320_c0_g2~~TRINITY_DN320_c0_g2_i6.p1  ORF type:complete len:140 (-),score=8.94 TRINITY_DN320_c0_g2_i6:532-951(-)
MTNTPSRISLLVRDCFVGKLSDVSKASTAIILLALVQFELLNSCNSPVSYGRHLRHRFLNKAGHWKIVLLRCGGSQQYLFSDLCGVRLRVDQFGRLGLMMGGACSTTEQRLDGCELVMHAQHQADGNFDSRQMREAQRR